MFGSLLVIVGIIFAFLGICGSAIPKMKMSLGEITLTIFGRAGIILIIVGVVLLYWT
ncbi:MAG: hypothetical protein OEZ21_02285 [Candidatus Bathyarchaeota archaeon]|nr:hypothetical protein [Candidatus Bathyarchaeota archaeon]MDH5745775.1 hypothetical protein [Candidatus Bathyarchaeota archaeon]